MTRRNSVSALGAVLCLTLAACSHRSVAVCSGTEEIPAGVRKIRLEVENGTLDIAGLEDASGPRQVSYKGGVRMDAASDEELQKLLSVPATMTVEVDATDASVLVLRAPHIPEGVTGMIAFEGGIRLPADLPIEVRVTNNGHVTMVGRRARSEVTTRRGDLRFEDCDGGTQASTGHGVLIAFDHRGDLEVSTDLGDMQVFVREAGAKLTLSTGKGTIQCHVPEDLEFEVDARTEIGRIGNDFGFEVTKLGDYAAAMVGTRGRSTCKVILRTASGHIALIPRKFE